MFNDRRQFIKKSIALLTSGLFVSQPVNAQWLAENFSAGSLNKTLANLFKDKKITETDKISIKIPTIAENGAVVPVSVTSSLDDVKRLSILVEKNPVPLAARFELSADLDTFVSARLKIAETCDVIVIAETSDAFYSAKEKVKVTIGGCGG
ncbi:MAG: thiosulfate oxidation carrier protein SoxY [Methylococcaceae bacterium]